LVLLDVEGEAKKRFVRYRAEKQPDSGAQSVGNGVTPDRANRTIT
jgi:hypothetical protein